MKNEFFVCGEEVYVKLPRRKFPKDPLWTVIDLKYLDLMLSYHWFWRASHSTKTDVYYASKSVNVGWGVNKVVFLHNIIMHVSAKDKTREVDHKNIDSLNNREKNLRIVNRQINSFNKNLNKNNISGIAGVSWHRPTQSWRAHIYLNYKQIHLGLFKKKEDAIEARSKAEDAYVL